MDQHLLDFEIEPLDISELKEEQFSESEEELDNQEDDDEGSKHTEDDEDDGFSASASRRADPSTEPSTDESSQQTISRDEEAIFIKVRLPQGKLFTLTAHSNMNIADLKKILSEEFQVPSTDLDVWESADVPRLIGDDARLVSSFGVKNARLELHLTARDPDVELLLPAHAVIAPVDVLTVTLDEGRQVVVEIENQLERRFLGGFRCRQSSIEYLHAETQTCVALLKKEKPSRIIYKRSRTCQTNEIVDCLQQTSMTQGTQTSEPEGRVLSARSISEEVDLPDITTKVITIQRIWRGWKARQSFGREKRTEIKAEVAESRPGYSPAVFEVLYQLVERWRKKCLDHAYASKTEGPTRADFQDILEMQVSLLGVIERERVKLRERMRREKERRLLEESCSPVTWKGYKGVTVSMETVQSQRAAELKKLYDLLSDEKVPTEQRRENLGTVQAALRSQNNEKCSEILTLINRELQLLEMGFGYKEIESLHKRIEKLFINFIKDPKNIYIKTKSKERFYLCVQCKKMQPPTSFVIPLREPSIKLCASCHWVDNVSHKRVDHAPYQLMLRELRAEEMRRGSFDSLAFVLEAVDVQYLVEHIWHAHSAISQAGDLAELRLGRWEQARPWAPWNNVLLTRGELAEHAAVVDLDRVYGHTFIKNVRVKLLMAQMHFKSLCSLD